MPSRKAHAIARFDGDPRPGSRQWLAKSCLASGGQLKTCGHSLRACRLGDCSTSRRLQAKQAASNEDDSCLYVSMNHVCWATISSSGEVHRRCGIRCVALLALCSLEYEEAVMTLDSAYYASCGLPCLHCRCMLQGELVSFNRNKDQRYPTRCWSPGRKLYQAVNTSKVQKYSCHKDDPADLVLNNFCARPQKPSSLLHEWVCEAAGGFLSLGSSTHTR
eukprot:2039225-Amphidinium_carterae.1